MLENPYEQIYKKMELHKSYLATNETDTVELIRHLGFMYNTFGLAIKDLIKIVSGKYKNVSEKIIEEQTSEKAESQESRPHLKLNGENETSVQSNIDLKGGFQELKVSSSTATIKSKPLPSTAETAQIEESKIGILPLEKQNSSISSSKKSSFSLISHDQKLKITQIQNINDISKFNSQFFSIESPKRQPSQSIEGQSDVLALSHKQKFTDPSYCIIIEQQDDEEVIPNSMFLRQVAASSKQETAKQDEENTTLSAGLLGSTAKASDPCIRVAGARKKKDRQKLIGVSCLQCEKYYKSMSMNDESMCRCTSRHKSNLPPKKIKNNFTQEFDI